MIVVNLENDNYYRQPDADNADRHIEFGLERKYVAITKSGFSEVGWKVPEKQRASKASRCFDVGYDQAGKMRVMPKLPMVDKSNDPMVMLPHNEQTWQKLSAISGQVNAMRESLASAIRAQDFSKVFIPKAAAAPKKPAVKPAASVKPDPKQPEPPLEREHSAVSSQHSAKAKPALGSAEKQDSSAGKRDKALREALGWTDDKLWIKLRTQGGTDKEIMAALGKALDWGADGGGGTSSQEFTVCFKGGKEPRVWFDTILPQGKPSLEGAALVAETRRIVGIPDLGVGKGKKKSKPQRGGTNGDNSAREHLVVKYQGKELTLGHGPLGNYLVEALRKHYPELRSAWVLKDNKIQLTFDGTTGIGMGTMDAAEFEHKINNPPSPPRAPQSNFESFVNIGRNAQAAVDQVIAKANGNGAIAKLHELADNMQPEDPPLPIPSVILVAAGFSEKATAEIYEPREILVRLPKKPVGVITLAELEQMILDQIKAAEPEKELVPA